VPLHSASFENIPRGATPDHPGRSTGWRLKYAFLMTQSKVSSASGHQTVNSLPVGVEWGDRLAVLPAARRKRATEETGSRFEPGQRHAAIGDPKKLARLVERRAEVRRLIEEFHTNQQLRADGDSGHELTVSITAGRQRIAATAAGSGPRKPTLGYRQLWCCWRAIGPTTRSASITYECGGCIFSDPAAFQFTVSTRTDLDRSGQSR
jgi:hypothetical protein